MRRDLGDFQTPPGLVDAVLDRLKRLGVAFGRVLEPTCGQGRFLSAILRAEDRRIEMRGFEIQPEHLADANAACASFGRSDVLVELADVFAVDLSTRLSWRSKAPLLVVGNPPWITTAELGRLASDNRPSRTKIEGLSGLDARTGRSNFDLAEAVWIKLLSELDEPGGTIALLCKTAAARNVLRWAVRTSRPIASASIHRIDARKWFDATVDACLFVVRLGSPTTDRAEVFADLSSDVPVATIGVVDGLLVADLDAFDAVSSGFGRSTRVWRQGVKHDAATVMELVENDGRFLNGSGESVDVEPEFLFPLLKGVDLSKSASVDRPIRRVIATHRRLGEDTRSLEESAPRLWAYLHAHADAFEARKSKVYEGKPPFSMFGIGDYTFAPHKVAIAGVHRSTRFREVGPVDGRPVLLDDTCYFLPCADASEADRLCSTLNGPTARGLIDALTFADAKRPITKAILQRIDIDAISERMPASSVAIE